MISINSCRLHRSILGSSTSEKQALNVVNASLSILFYRYITKNFNAIALTDANANYKPSEYHTRQFGTELRFAFPVYKVIEQDADELEKSENPFSMVILTVLEAIKGRRKDPSVLKDIRIALVRNLLRHQISKKKIRSILTFIRYYGRPLKEPWNFQFEKEVELLTTKNKTAMGVVEIVRQQLIEKAEKEGRQKGREEGIEKGIEKGREENKFLATKNMLHRNFSVSDICDILEVTPEFVHKVKEELRERNS